MNNCNLNPDIFAKTVKKLIPHEAIEDIADAMEVTEARIRRQIYPEDSDDTYLFRTMRLIRGYKKAAKKHPEYRDKFKEFVSWWIAELSSLIDEPKQGEMDLAIVLFNAASNSVVNAHLERKPMARRDAAIKAEALLREILSADDVKASRVSAGVGEGSG